MPGLPRLAAGSCLLSALACTAATAELPIAGLPVVEPGDSRRARPEPVGGYARPCLELPRAPADPRPDADCPLYVELSGSGLFELAGHDGARPGSRFEVGVGNDGPWASEAWAGFGTRGAGWLGARFWIGQRKYRRHDLEAGGAHYWDATGAGVGVERIRLGLGRLALAYFPSSARDTRALGASEYQRLDLRLERVPTALPGRFDIGLDLREHRGADARAGTGALLTLRHQRKVQADDFQETALQVGRGLASSLAVVPAHGAGERALAARAVHQTTARLGEHAALSIAGSVEHRPRGPDWLTAGARPVWTAGRLLEVEFELLLHRMRPSDGAAHTLREFTAAVAIREGDDIPARPEAEAFVSVVHGADDVRDTRLPGRAALGAAETTVGIEVEHLW